MNERIKLLAEQAGFNPYNYQGSNLALFEKFAELIIRECMTICKNHPSRIVSNNWNADAVAPDIVYRLSELFGVEE